MEKEIGDLAPIILFAYNRPSLVRQTLHSLRANHLSDRSTLFIYCDGPKPGATALDLNRINEVRRVVRDEHWCRKVTIVEQNENKGLAASVIDGVTEIVNKYGKVIVVEDDVLLSPYFLQFMNQALEQYQQDDRVLSIGSWNYFCSAGLLKREYFFFRFPDSIAWATYKRSWNLFEKDAGKALNKLHELKKMGELNAGADGYFEKMLGLQMQGRINSWAIRWTATAIINGMLSVFPSRSLSKHIGFGVAATHEKTANDYNRELALAESPVKVEIQEVCESAVALEEWKKFVIRNFIQVAKPGKSFIGKVRNDLYRLGRKAIRQINPPRLSEGDVLIQKARLHPRYSPAEIKFGNLKLHVSDFLSVAYQLKEYFEDERMRADLSGPVSIIDCGANVGVSVAYFKKCFPDAIITAFEADPGIFSLLKRNVLENSLTGIELHNKAVWTSSKGVNFGTEGADAGSIHLDGNKTFVESIRLKDLLEERSRVDLLKMDIEGAEVEVIVDCGESLRKVNYLFVEYHSLLHEKQRLDELLGVLRHNGFRYFIHSIGNQSRQPFVEINAYNGMDGQLDIYAINTGFYAPENIL